MGDIFGDVVTVGDVVPFGDVLTLGETVTPGEAVICGEVDILGEGLVPPSSGGVLEGTITGLVLGSGDGVGLVTLVGFIHAERTAASITARSTNESVFFILILLKNKCFCVCPALLFTEKIFLITKLRRFNVKKCRSLK